MSAAGAEALQQPAPVLRLEAVRKSFGDNLVLDGIDLDVAPGEVLVVIGASGSGKSTLLRCVNLLEPVDSGRVFLEGEEVTAKGTRVSSVRQRMYRGYCIHGPQAMAAAADMRAKKAEIIGVLSQIPGLDPRTRDSSANYLNGFFSLIATDESTAKALRGCI